MKIGDRVRYTNTFLNACGSTWIRNEIGEVMELKVRDGMEFAGIQYRMGFGISPTNRLEVVGESINTEPTCCRTS